jgi:flagellar basal-body rod modification protein FlgD
MLITTHAAASTTGTTATGAPGITTGAAGTSGSSSLTGSDSASGVGGTTLGGTDFLTLMLAQLKNQDPTSPVDSNTFLTQLSQLSEVEGITSLNTSFGTLATSLSSSQALQASSLLGHQALVGTSTATTAAAGSAVTGAVLVPQTSSAVTVDVTNSAGVLVKQISLGAQSTGIANFSWDGSASDGSKAPAGTYTISAQVNGVASGTAVNTYVNGTVDSVTMGAGAAGLILNVAGIGSVPFSDVEQISN